MTKIPNEVQQYADKIMLSWFLLGTLSQSGELESWIKTHGEEKVLDLLLDQLK